MGDQSVEPAARAAVTIAAARSPETGLVVSSPRLRAVPMMTPSAPVRRWVIHTFLNVVPTMVSSRVARVETNVADKH
jgi:hypothetical protein